jgi:chemotaxis protein MotB
MALRSRRQASNGLDAWPGYVDALSTLLMVIIFVMLVFFLAQAFLSVALSGRTRQLTEATRKAAGLTNQLSSEQGRATDLQQSVARLKQDLEADEQELAIADQQRREAAQLADALKARLAQEALRSDKLSEQLNEAHALTDQQLADARKRAELQLAQLKAQLDLTKQESQRKDEKVASLDQQLSAAMLASKVEELQQYRSEFFGRLRTVLANRPGIQVVGDRFVFQSEVLFATGKAELTPDGIAQMTELAKTIKAIAAQIPPDVHWVLRVDGHTDRQKIEAPTEHEHRKGKSKKEKTSHFASNWELSTARAISVVKLLMREGVPASHLAAAGFGEFQPIATGDTPEAYAKNRRIELRLTDR